MENLVGITEDELSKQATTYETFPDDRNKSFFLYNVKTGLLLNVGGYWGMHVSLQEYGMRLWVFQDGDKWFHFQQNLDKDNVADGNNEGCCLEYFYDSSYSGDKATTGNGVFVDRDIYVSSTNKTIIQRGWKLEAVDDGKNTYRLYTYPRATYYTSWGKTYATWNTNKKYYLQAAATQGDVDKNCGVVDGSSSDYDADRSQWRIISYQQIYDLQSERLSYKKSLDLSFKLMCPGFNRDNRQLEQWVTERYDTGTDAGTGIRFGLEKYYKTSTKGNYDDNLLTEDYVFPDGSSDESSRTYTKGDINSYRTYLGKYFCADIKKARGAIYQVVHVDHGGSYVIECKAFSTTRKARLFAALLKDNTKGTTDYTIDPNTVHETVIMQTENMSNDEQTKLHIAEENMDYAGKEFYGSHKYFNSVLVQVRVPNDGTGANIVFGVRVGKKDEATVESDDEWTVFDDFRLLYAGSDIDHDLILDEDKDNLNYLKTCSQNYEDVILHLNKSSFKKNLKKWNTITLPVNLTKDQFTQAFGSNARLARLTALTKDEIQFTTEKIANLGDDDIALSAYVPYIIYPTKDLVSEWNPSYTALLSETGTGTEVKEHRVTIARDHIDIPNVSFAKKDVNVNDLDKMNTNTWVSNLTDVAKKSDDCPIITDGTLAAYGTFARTYGSIMDNDVQTTFTVDKTNPIISGRDDLRGCYFFHEGKLIFAGSNVRGLRGFSVWFKPIKNATESNQARFSLDGIDYTTDIDRVFAADNDPSLTQFAKRGIYNVNGQLVRKGSSDTQGLPSGIYIVNGKKVLVK